jgi:hypothetical protein
MNLMLSTLVLLAGLTQSSGSAGASLSIPQPSSNSQSATTTVTTNEESLVSESFLPAQAHETVLVVPTPDLPAESVADLAEDLAVMCRILDKTLMPARVTTGFAYGGQSDVFSFATGSQAHGAQGLYLDGYGALFFVPVDYPLVPTEPQEPAPAKAKDSADTVWSATVKEMSGQPGDQQQAARSALAYDPQKVENLKKAAINTLSHASNIRMRRPQDVVTLVMGPLDDNRSWERSGRRGPRMGTGSSRGAFGQAGVGTARATPGKPTSALLIMRVTKADVDALAKGQLTAAQFAEKVQTISTPVNAGAATAPQPAPAPATPAR